MTQAEKLTIVVGVAGIAAAYYFSKSAGAASAVLTAAPSPLPSRPIGNGFIGPIVGGTGIQSTPRMAPLPPVLIDGGDFPLSSFDLLVGSQSDVGVMGGDGGNLPIDASASTDWQFGTTIADPSGGTGVGPGLAAFRDSLDAVAQTDADTAWLSEGIG